MYHFGTHKNVEVDVILENPAGDPVGIEVKLSSRVEDQDVCGLELLRDLTGDRLRRGVVLYGGKESVSLGRRLHALPIDALWQIGTQHRSSSATLAAHIICWPSRSPSLDSPRMREQPAG